MPRARFRLAWAALPTVLLAAALPASAPAATSEPRTLPTVRDTLRVSDSARRVCTEGRLAGASGVVTRRWTATDEGVVTARLQGYGRSDWDLALVDSATGAVLAGSAAFGSNEVATALVRRGQALSVQACRRFGPDADVPLSISFTAVKLAAPKEKTSLVEVYASTRFDFDRLRSLGFDLTDHSDGKRQHALLHGSADARRLRQEGYSFRTVVPDVAAQDRADRAAEQNSRVGMPSGSTSYRNLDDYENEMKTLAEENPTMVRKVTLPKKSIDGRDIVGIEVATGVSRTDDGRPAFVNIGIHHAREWPSGEATIEFAYDLIKNPLGDARRNTIRDNARTFFFPVQNPDGFVVTRTVGSMPNDDLPATPGTPQQIVGGAGYKRKNCRPALGDDVPCEARQGPDTGVDTNRNYGQEWGGAGTSSDPTSLTYRGEGPFSEPENQAIREFMLGIQSTLLITNHTFTGLILRPPGVARDGPAPDEDRMRKIGDAMARETDYTSQYSYQLYDTTGTTDDWIYGVLSSFSFTPEIGKINFHPSYPNTVREYDGYELTNKDGTKRKLGGLREAYTIAGEAAVNPDSHSVIEGTAPAGATLRIKRDTITTTSPVEDDGETARKVDVLPEHRESTMTVPADGRFTWHVSPSSRPRENPQAAWRLSCERDGQEREVRDVFVARAQRVRVDLVCGGAAPTPTPCRDAIRPTSRFASRSRLRVTSSGISLRGTSTDTGCPGASVRRVTVSVALATRPNGCRFLQSNGRLGSRRSCRRTVYLPGQGGSSWTFTRRARLPRGEYKVWVRAYDAAGNVEKKAFRRNFVRLRRR